MARDRRLVREGKKLIVTPEHVVTNHGDDYWTAAKFLAKHPKYKKTTIDNTTKTIQLNVSKTMDVDCDLPSAKHVDEVVHSGGMFGTWQRRVYDLSYEKVASGTWLYLYPEVQEYMARLPHPDAMNMDSWNEHDWDEYRAWTKRLSEAEQAVTDAAPHTTVSVQTDDGKTSTVELNSFCLSKLDGPVRIDLDYDYAALKYKYVAKPSSVVASAKVLIKESKTNLLIYDPPSSTTASKGKDSTSYLVVTVLLRLRITATGRDTISYEVEIETDHADGNPPKMLHGNAASPFSVDIGSSGSSTDMYEEVDDDDFPPGVDWKP